MIGGQQLIRRFMSKVRPEEGGCLVWTGRKRGPYGAFWYQGKFMAAHKASHLLFVGPVPEGLQVNHTCDNPVCVNPAHLLAGTQLENRRQCVLRGRTATGDRNGSRLWPQCLRRGERHGRAKLTKQAVIDIRQEAKEGAQLLVLAHKYGVSDVLIGLIVHRRIWKHVA